jgi:sec-independent protein translocase protein TatB
MCWRRSKGPSMFGIGFWEFVLIIGVALLVLGPEKIGPLMRTLGRAMREIQRGVTQMRHELKIDEDLNDIERIRKNMVKDASWSDEDDDDDEVVEKTSTREGAGESRRLPPKEAALKKPWDGLHEEDDVQVERVKDNGTDEPENE